MPYDVAEIRQKLRKQMSGKFSDPDEFRPPKVDAGQEVQYRFYVLPPLAMGDVLKSGKVERSMDQFFVQHANHWLQDKPHPCPRVWNDDPCPICEEGFTMLRDPEIKKDEDRRKKVLNDFMPNSYYMANIFFTSWSGNPEDLRGRVKFYNAPKTCFDIWTEALMREDAGDKEDPKAWGVFFDENAAFQFQLTVTKQGRNNSYRTSKFLPNKGEPQPMAGKPESIEKLLKFRHNLWTKIQEPNMDKLNKIFATLMHGDDEDDGDGGFDQDETKATTTQPVEKAKKPKAAKEAVKEAIKDEPVDDGPVDDGPVDDGPVDDGPVDTAPVEDDKIKESPVADADEGDDEEIDALLDQLGDDD